MTCDPRSLGAKCDECPLREISQPVPTEQNNGSQFVVVGDYPGENEEREGRPFVGPNGSMMQSTFGSLGLKRRDANWTNVVLCRPPESDMNRFLEKLRKRNREIVKENIVRTSQHVPPLPLVPTPMECCAPRLWNEVMAFDKVLAVGGLATKVVFNSTISVMAVRGSPTELDRFGKTLKVVPTLHPSFVSKNMRWMHVMKNDILRAVKWWNGVADWSPPVIYYHPRAEDLRAFLADPSVPYWTYDVETDGIESLTCGLRCVGIGTPEKVVIVGYDGIQGGRPFYQPHEQARVHEVLKEFFADPNRMKVGHNAGNYDRIVIEQHFGVTPAPLLDTIMLHRLVESELPHNLGFLGSMYTGAPSWKTDRDGKKLAYGSETDHELHEYCSLDVAVTAAVVPPLYEQVRLRDQMRLVSSDHRIQVVCAEMHRIGMYVDQSDRGVREKALVQETFSHREALCKLVEMPKLNPGSPHQLRELLFEKWKIEPPVDDELRYTLSGDPSTSDNVLRSCLSIPGLTELQLNAIRHIRYYRKAQKLLGTYVAKLRFNTDLAEAGWDEGEEYEERETRKQYGEEKKGIVDPRTGRMYPGYNAHVAVTGRLSSSKPINAQNFPSKLRSMVTAAPGHILVGADADQLELRIAASLWKSELYLAALAAGADPHASTALAVFGDKFRACNGFPGGEWKGDLFIPNGTGKWASDAKRLRDLAKRVQYASQYAASVETVHRVIAQTETNNEKPTEAYPWPTVLPYLDISVREVRMMHEKWVENAKFDGGWDMEMETYRTYGFLAEPILGRRRDFLDGENLNEIVNFRIQASGASLMNKALLQIHEQIPLHKWGPHTGIINQCHDSIVVECPLDGAVYVPEKKKWEAPKGSIAWNVKHIIEEAMNQTTPALPGVAITATAEIGMLWNEV